MAEFGHLYTFQGKKFQECTLMDALEEDTTADVIHVYLLIFSIAR